MIEKDAQKGLIVFPDKNIRRLFFNNEWFYSVGDIVEVLTESPTPRQYWGKVKEREFIALELSPIWVQLKMPAEDGKLRYTDCVNTKNASSSRVYDAGTDSFVLVRSVKEIGRLVERFINVA